MYFSTNECSLHSKVVVNYKNNDWFQQISVSVLPNTILGKWETWQTMAGVPRKRQPKKQEEREKGTLKHFKEYVLVSNSENNAY